MRRLTDARVPDPRDERGAVAVLVALLAVPLIGFAAYAVDVAALYQERRVLQNGADIAALLAARDCGLDEPACTSASLVPVSEQYADANADDATTQVEAVTVDMPGRTVTVDTRSRTASGGTGVRHWFAQILGQQESVVRARGRAAWDLTATSLERAFPLAFCLGEFQRLTSGGTSFSTTPYQVVYMLPGNVRPPCGLDASAGPNSAYPGGFGWLEGDGDCLIPASVGWMAGRPGEALPSTSWGNVCADFLEDVIEAMVADPSTPPLLIPIFDNFRGQGAGGELRVAGFGAFRPTGFRFSGTHTYPDNQACGIPQVRCITGYFTEYLTTAGSGAQNAPSFGLTTVSLVP